MHIAFITSNYPYRLKPIYGVFVQELVSAFSRNNTKCTVVRPMSIFKRLCIKSDPVLSNDQSKIDNPIQIWSPGFLSVSAKNVGSFNTYSITQYNYERVVYKIISMIKPSPDLLYGHFLYPSGAVAVRLGRAMKLRSVVAVGDSTISDYFTRFGLSKCIRDFSGVTGVVAVSNKNKEECKEKLRIPEEKIKVLPNGVDLSVFGPLNRLEMRKKFGLPTDKFIIAFTGSFIERKGPDRLLSAAADLGNEIGMIFIGSGNMSLNSKNILFKGTLQHSRIPEILSAADIFVLPTLAEGSCNAIIEALACGLPIITSKGEFNDDIVDDNVAIRVDPMDIREIRNAILRLYNDEDVRKKMSFNALIKAKHHDIDLRVTKMLEWIRELE